MSSQSGDDESVERAAEYMRTTFGSRALEETEKALAYAKEVNNETAIEAFTAILRKLRLSSE